MVDGSSAGDGMVCIAHAADTCGPIAGTYVVRKTGSVLAPLQQEAVQCTALWKDQALPLVQQAR